MFMKNLRKCAGILLLVVIGSCFLSCSNNDDNSGTQAKYVLTMQGSNVVVTGISYRNGAGQMVEGFGSDENDNNWNKTVNIVPPFNATFQVTANNITDQTLTYKMSIYVNGKSMATQEGSIPPQSGVFSDSVSFDIPQ